MRKDLAALYTFSFIKSLQFSGALVIPFYTARIGLITLLISVCMPIRKKHL
ncbi:MAG TPA: hypothetical protein PLU33_07035 [Treponemataceae bacterium]|nr:hypothetical protein [Treponemataceae bacterium]HQL04880.1 hypothetical protein [Treponemataceae bacterium]